MRAVSDEVDATAIRVLKPRTDGDRKRQAVLLVMSGPTTGQTIHLDQKETWKIGRSLDCDIVFQEDSVSRNHCRFFLSADGQWVIEDNASANGTWIDGQRTASFILQGGEKIQLGSVIVIKFVLQDEIEAAFQKELYESATRDALTGLGSKRYFVEHLQIEFTYHRRTQRPLSIVMLDLDHFKKINDTYGHPAGDLILTHVGGLLNNVMRTGDAVGRYGGEEIIFLLRDTPLQGAKTFAERLRELIQGHIFIYQNQKIPVTASFGAATYTHQNYKTPEELIKAADQFLYKAKKEGRNRVLCLLDG